MHEASIHVSRNGQSLGILTEEQLRAGLAQQAIRKEDLCWTSGMAEWLPISQRYPHLLPSAASSSTPTQAIPAGPTTASAQPTDMYPSGWQRFSAHFLDGFGTLVFFCPLGLLVALVVFAGLGMPEDLAPLLFHLVILPTSLLLYYGILGNTARHATWGQRAAGFKMVDAQTGLEPSKAQVWNWAWLQVLCHLLFYCCGFGYLAYIPILGNAPKQSLVDRWSGIVMVKTK